MTKRTFLGAGLALYLSILPVGVIAQEGQAEGIASLELAEMLGMCANLSDLAAVYLSEFGASAAQDKQEEIYKRLVSKLSFEVSGDMDRFLFEMHRGNQRATNLNPDDYLDTLAKCSVLGR